MPVWHIYLKFGYLMVDFYFDGSLLHAQKMTEFRELLIDLMAHVDDIKGFLPKEEKYRNISDILKKLFDYMALWSNPAKIETYIVLYRRCEQDLYRAHLKGCDPKNNPEDEKKCLELEAERGWHMELMEQELISCDIEVYYDASEKKIKINV